MKVQRRPGNVGWEYKLGHSRVCPTCSDLFNKPHHHHRQRWGLYHLPRPVPKVCTSRPTWLSIERQLPEAAEMDVKQQRWSLAVKPALSAQAWKTFRFGRKKGRRSRLGAAGVCIVLARVPQMSGKSQCSDRLFMSDIDTKQDMD